MTSNCDKIIHGDESQLLQVNQDNVFRRGKVSLFGLLGTNQAGNSCNS